VQNILQSGRMLDVLVGAGGTGKTATLAVLVAGWQTAHGPGSVIGLAPSANAAQVLSDQVGIETETPPSGSPKPIAKPSGSLGSISCTPS